MLVFLSAVGMQDTHVPPEGWNIGEENYVQTRTGTISHSMPCYVQTILNFFIIYRN